MKWTRTPNRALHVLVLLLASFAWASAQQRPLPAQAKSSEEPQAKAVHYLFVSPNTRENLSLRESLKLLYSREESQLVRSIRRLASCLGLRPVVLRTVGNWSDGAEHSTLSRIFSDRATARYADARLGKRARQKSVLYFRRDSAGTARMYVLYARPGRGGLARLARVLDQSGVDYRTLVPARGRTALVYVVDLKDELQDEVGAAARRLGARLVVMRGTGEFIGDDSDREKAQGVYDGVIEQYETARPQVRQRCARE